MGRKEGGGAITTLLPLLHETALGLLSCSDVGIGRGGAGGVSPKVGWWQRRRRVGEDGKVAHVARKEEAWLHGLGRKRGGRRRGKFIADLTSGGGKRGGGMAGCI